VVRTVQKSYRKNILREMKSSISRVVSLFGIVALGVMMLTGLMCIAPDMRTAAQKYYVQQNVFDLRVLSTLGLSQGDIDAIAAVDGVDAVQAVKYQDVEGNWTGDEQTTVARLYQLPADPQAEAVETTGADAVAAAINADPDNWTTYNTTLVVQGGKVLEVRRIWVP
jgi:putative ABC transport system permease protein